MVISENHYCGFVGNVEVDSGLTLYTHKPLFDPSRAYLNFEIGQFWPKNGIFSNYDHFADMADFHKKKLGKCAEGSFEPFSSIWTLSKIPILLKVNFWRRGAKNSHFSKIWFYHFPKIFDLWVKNRNFWVPKKTPIPKLLDL